MPHLGCTSLAVAGHLTERKGIHQWPAAPGHTSLLGWELVLLLLTLHAHGSHKTSPSSWQCWEWCMLTKAYSVFILDYFMQGEFNASIAYTAHKVKLHQ